MSYFIGNALALLVPSLSLGVGLFVAGTLMDYRDEEEHRGLMGNLIGAGGVMAGSLIFLFVAQWVPFLELLLRPFICILIFFCFRLGSLIETVALCILALLLMNMTLGFSMMA